MESKKLFCGPLRAPIKVLCLMTVATAFGDRGIARDMFRDPEVNFRAVALAVTIEVISNDSTEVTVVCK